MALNDILTSMDGARDALVTAINAKGGSLADNATFYQCADAVGSLSGGTSAEYYKCASVSAEAATPEGATFTMQLTLKALSITSTYHWVMDDTSKTGTERTWTGTVKGDSGTHTLHFNGTYWQVVDGLGNTTATETADDPWDITNWHNADGGDVSCTFSDVSSASTGSKTWSGYKAVFDSTAGTWSFESDVTAGLAYTSVTPVVGVIYTIDALVTVASVYTGFYATSSPLNPGSNNSGVWEITASSFLDSNRNAYKAFDEDLNSDRGCWHSQSGMPQWIQWRNTESKVLIKSYFLQNRSGGAGDFYPVEWTLSGSDDGVDWTELDNVVIQDSDTASGSKTLRNLASNNTAYYYHRITVTKAYNNSYATIGFLQAFNYLQE